MNKRLNEKLLKDAFVEAMLRKYEREMEGCEESPICSPEHYKKMSEIVGFDVTKPRCSKQRISMRKKIVIIMIAAVLALTGCVTGYIYRHEIGNFIEEVYENYIKIYFDDETPSAPTEIEDVYTLTYLPKDFVLTNERYNKVAVYFEYTNTLGDSFIFSQTTKNFTNHFLDSETGDDIIIENKNYIIYCRHIDNSYYYRWNSDKYSFLINTTQKLSDTELTNIISGLQLIR